MRFSDHFKFWRSSRAVREKSSRPHRTRVSRLETLETRDLLSLSTSSADYKALVKASSFEGADDSAIWVTTLGDVVNASDGKVSLREALDYAGQNLAAGTVSSVIRFSVGGTIKLSSSLQSLKVLSKSVTIDASDVGGVTVQAQRSLAFYVFGGTASSPSTVSLTDLSITGGSTTSAKGGAIQLANNCNLSAVRCVISNNVAANGLGGGVYASSGALTFVDSYFSSNSSSGSSSKGGAVYLESGSVVARGTTFVNNASGEGGAVYVKSGDATFASCFFDRNEATNGNGGALYSEVVANVDATAFRDNVAASFGGAIYTSGDGESIFADSIFTGNAAKSGGALATDSEAVSLTSSRFQNNSASENGGALYIGQNASLQSAGAAFFGNTGVKEGGAVYNVGSLYLSTSRLEENESDSNGGALYSTGYFELRETSFNNNVASNYGGAIALESNQPSWLLNSSVVNNVADEGGGIYSNGSLTIADSVVSSNVASTSGGGIANLGSAYIGRSAIDSNQSLGATGAGGGILNYVNASLTLSNSYLRDNVSVSGLGGGIANSGSAAFFETAVVGNSAGQFGGGVYNASSFVAQYSTFYDNESENGGAIADTFGSSSQIANSTFWGNLALNLGGALYSYGSPDFQSSTISHNAASTANSAAFYSADAASSAPSIDSTTTIENNYAIADLPQLQTETSLILSDAESGAVLTDNLLLFGSSAVNGATITKKLAIANSGTASVELSNFKVLGNIDSASLSYTLQNGVGDPINAAQKFTLEGGETIYLTISLSPKKVGGRITSLSWTTRNSSAGGLQTKTFEIVASHEISRAAAATYSVATLNETEGFNISLKENGVVTISLSRAPANNTIMYLQTSGDDVKLSSDVLLFTTDDYNVAQEIAVSIDPEKLVGQAALAEVVITPQLLSSDPSFDGTTFPSIKLNVADYVLFYGDCCVDINDLAPSGMTRWDFTGNGYADAITYGSPFLIDASRVSGDTITYMRTRNGVTTTKSFDVVKVSAPPTAVAEVAFLDVDPAFVRISLAAETSPVVRWRIDWGDGSPYSEVSGLSNSALFAHNYSQDGDYVISVELVDVEGVGKNRWTELCERKVSGVSNSSSAILEFAEDNFLADQLSPDDIEALAADLTVKR